MLNTAEKKIAILYRNGDWPHFVVTTETKFLQEMAAGEWENFTFLDEARSMDLENFPDQTALILTHYYVATPKPKEIVTSYLLERT